MLSDRSNHEPKSGSEGSADMGSRAVVTHLLRAAAGGDPRASEKLLPLVYEELRKLARANMQREVNAAAGHTLQATALVHEAYLRLLGPDAAKQVPWNSRGHFFTAAAEAMRRILIDHARAKHADKRGGAGRKISLDDAKLSLDRVRIVLEGDRLGADDLPAELLDLNDAIDALAAEDAAKAELVKLRFFAGLTLEQAARALGISPATADRHWAYTKAWLYAKLAR